MPLRTARDVDLTDRVGERPGRGCVSTQGPFYSRGSVVKQLRESVECPAASCRILEVAPRKKEGGLFAIRHIYLLGVVMVSN